MMDPPNEKAGVPAPASERFQRQPDPNAATRAVQDRCDGCLVPIPRHALYCDVCIAWGQFGAAVHRFAQRRRPVVSSDDELQRLSRIEQRLYRIETALAQDELP